MPNVFDNVVSDAPVDSGTSNESTETVDTGGSESGTEVETAGGIGVSPESAKQSKQPAKSKEEPSKENADLNALLAKNPLNVKVNGKVISITSAEQAMRILQKGAPIDKSLQELQQQRQQLAPIAELLNRLQSDDPEVIEATLAKLLNKDKFSKVALNALRKQYQDEEKYANLSPRERELQEKLDAQEAQLREYNEAKAAQEEQARAIQEQKVVQNIRNEMSANVMKALDILDLPQDMESIAVEFMKPVMKQMLLNGIPVDPQYLAEKIGPMFDSLIAHRTSKLDGEKLIKFFGNDLGKKYRKALLDAASKPKTPKAGQEPAKSKEPEEKLDFSKMRMF